MSNKNYIAVTDAKELLKALKQLEEMFDVADHNPEDYSIITYRILAGGACHTKRHWYMDENDDGEAVVALEYMDEVSYMTETEFFEYWDACGEGQFIAVKEFENTTMYDSYVGGIGAFVMSHDPRIGEGLDDGSIKPKDLANLSNLLCVKSNSLKDLVAPKELYEDVADVIAPFSSSELKTILEISRLALADAETFDMVVEDTDISDSEMIALREKIHKHMDA